MNSEISSVREFQLKISTIEEQIVTACILEASAKKPGNVHPDASFDDLSYTDFVAAAQIAGSELSQASKFGIGQVILSTNLLTREKLETNVNLGITLLLAPLVAASAKMTLEKGISYSLSSIDLKQTKLIFEAIQIAHPGGMGNVSDSDVKSEPQDSIVDVMKLAADRDLIAKQYVNDFGEVLNFGREKFLYWTENTRDWETAIIGTQLEYMSQYPDSLISRKCGRDVSHESSRLAKAVLAAGWPETENGMREIFKLDSWLRSDGNQRNPGTTADMIAAVLFAAIRDKMWIPPEVIMVS